MTVGKVHDPRIRARMARKRNAERREDVNGKRIARPLGMLSKVCLNCFLTLRSPNTMWNGQTLQ